MKKLFDDLAFEYDFMNNIISLFLHKTVKKLAVCEIRGDKILDLCTGTGDIAGIIKKKFPKKEVTGIDISLNMLKIARQKYPDISFLEENASKLSFEDETFDTVISAYGFRNIENKSQAISEIRRVLKKSGVFVHLDFGEKSKLYDIFLRVMAWLFSKNKKSYEYLINSKNTFKDPKCAFERAHFKLIKSKYFLFKMAKLEVFEKN